MSWTIVPFLNRCDLTLAAAKDALAQTNIGPAQVLIIGNGISSEDRGEVERFCADHPLARAWMHDPALPSLAATWNRALRFCWEQGEGDALVINNDVRLTSDTFSTLRHIMKDEAALLVTATGVEEEETLFAEAAKEGQEKMALGEGGMWRRGGPGFSCFLISKACHEKYQFDEMLTPAFCEDSSFHREMILGGDGEKIFGTNVRYLHLGGQTLKNMGERQRAATEAAISRGARAHYLRKWGGGVNEEKWISPFNEGMEDLAAVAARTPKWILDRYVMGESVTNPALFDEIRGRW